MAHDGQDSTQCITLVEAFMLLLWLPTCTINIVTSSLLLFFIFLFPKNVVLIRSISYIRTVACEDATHRTNAVF